MIEMEERMERMEVEMDAKDKRIAALEADRPRIDNSGWWECAWREEWTGFYLDNSNITYERMLYSNTYMDGSSIEGAGLNIDSGVFTVPFDGVWTINYSATSVQYSGDIIQAHLRLNGQTIEASQYWASYLESTGRMASLGSRTLHLQLAPGDALTLREVLTRNKTSRKWLTVAIF